MKIRIFAALLLCVVFATAQKRKIILPDGHSLLVQKAKVDKQGRYLYTIEREKCIMWDLKTGHQLYTFRATGSEYGLGLDISPDGKLLAIAMDGPLYLFNTETGEQVAKSSGYDSYKDCVFSADGSEIYTACDGIKILQTNTLQLKRSFKSNLTYKAKLELVSRDRVLLYTSGAFEMYAVASGLKTFEAKYNGKDYSDVTYLPMQQMIVGTSNQGTTDFYDINSGNLKGSIAVNAYDKAVIPSINSSEVLITGATVREGFLALNVYSTETFKLTATLTNTDVVKYHSTTTGFFDGKLKTAYLVNYNIVVEYSLAARKIARTFTGVAADLGMDVFNPMEYNPATGRLHINTDDEYLKTIDLYRMVPVYHTGIGSLPTALSVSASGDTAGIFSDNAFVVKNIRSNKLIKQGASGGTGFLDRNAFFFSNDGRNMFYASTATDNTLLKKYNVATGVTETVITVKGFGPLNVHPDKTMMAGFESAYQLNTASVWDLQTKQRIFSKRMPTDGEYDDEYATLSANKKQVLVVDGGTLGIYDVQSGNAVAENVKVGGLDKFGSCAASSDLSLFAEGDRNGQLDVYNSSGKKLWGKRGHNNTIRRILFSPDDKVMYTVSYDHTVKVWEAKTGRFIGVLYMFKGSNDYVFMDEDGRFDGSPEGIKKIYSIINKNEVPLDRVFEKYYTPNLYARSVTGETFYPIDADNIRPMPKVKISYAAVQRNLEVDDDKPTFQNTTGAAEITVHASAPDDAVDEIRLFHNGKAVNLATRNLFVTDDKSAESEKKYVINLLPGKNTFRAIALNSQRTESNADEIDVMYKSATAPVVNNAPVATGVLANVERTATLYLVVVGINKYANPTMSLNYALADATAFKSEIETGAKTVINNVKTFFVTDDNANHSGIINTFKQVQSTAKPQDVFVFYYAGHGVIGTDKEFYLVPQDVSDLKNVQSELQQKGIPSKLMQQYAVDIQAQKQLFVLDACQSAGAFAAMLSSDGDQQKNIAVVARSTGTHWIAASGAQQFANEFSQLGHGAFTYVLLQALKGQAASNKMITVNGLKNYLQINVPEMMKKYNCTPQYPASYGFGSDFPVEVLK